MGTCAGVSGKWVDLKGVYIMIYAKQIAPEFQESPLFLDEESFPENIAVCGNDRLIAHTPAVFDRVYNALRDGDLCSYLEELEAGEDCYYKNATAAIMDFLEPEKPRYSTRDIHALKELVKAFSECPSAEENGILCRVLSVVTGKEWDWQTIRGCCQGDWNEAFYPVDLWSREALNAFETEYFNTGSEWIIHDEEKAPESPEDINGYSVYCVAYDEEGIKKEIANIAGVQPDEVQLYTFEK